jgi:Tfp pilus assembly protein PilO
MASDTAGMPSGMGMSVGMIIGILVFMIILTLLVYYLGYRWYLSGQNTCEKLYPGNSLKNLRLQEECKDRKRGNWALPAAASIIS